MNRRKIERAERSTPSRRIRQPKAWAIGAFALIASGSAVAQFGGFGGSADRYAAPVDATRVYETRIGPAFTTVDGHYQGMGRLRGGTTARFHVLGRGAVSPVATEVDLEIRVIKPSRSGRLVVRSCDDRGGEQLRFAGRWTQATVRSDVAADGTVCIRTNRSTDLVVDVVAQVAPGGDDGGAPPVAEIVPVERVRILETRLGSRRYTTDGHYNRFGKIDSSRPTDVYVAGRGALPYDLDAVQIRVTTRGARTPGVFTVDGCGAGTQQLKFSDGRKAQSTFVVPVDELGRICVSSTTATHATIDALGYIAAGGFDEQPSTTDAPATTVSPTTTVAPTTTAAPGTTVAPTVPPTAPSTTQAPAPTTQPPAPTTQPPAPTTAPTTTAAPPAPTTTVAPAPPTTSPAPPPGGGMNMQLPGISPSRASGTASNEVLRYENGFTGGFNGLGEVRIICGTSHHDYVDPIVLPGQDGASHLHTFIGNVGVDADSTYESLRNEPGGSTCAGGSINKSAYWIPSLIDGNANAPLEPTLAFVYYKTGYWGQDGRDVQPIPPGLRMVSGNAATTVPQESWAVGWTCSTGGGGVPTGTIRDSASIPRCDLGQLLVLRVMFQQCWDGVNLDSPDHKSHMAHPNFQGQCPASHPVLIPQITLNVTWEMGPNGTNGYYMASDMMTPADAPPGLGAHADFFDAWTPEFQQSLVRDCLNQRKDCGVDALGDGYALIQP